jgi:hypothetical protein
VTAQSSLSDYVQRLGHLVVHIILITFLCTFSRTGSLLSAVLIGMGLQRHVGMFCVKVIILMLKHAQYFVEFATFLL